MPEHHPQSCPELTDRATRSEVYSSDEVAAAAGVSVEAIRELIAAAEIPTIDGHLVTLDEAVTAIDGLRSGRLRPQPWGVRPRVFGAALLERADEGRTQSLSALASSALHATVILVVAVATTVQITTASDDTDRELPQTAHLVFLAEPGPGGGGGGGGLKLPTPPPRAERRGPEIQRSPVPERVEPRRVEPEAEPEPPPLEHEPLPPIFAPLAAARADGRDVRGLLIETTPAASDPDSRGPGLDGGVGSGGGVGIGKGSGSGVGPGSGGGTGGGPYRPGSGIEPPRLLYEARPRYTEEARQRGVEGDVVLEIVVLTDGSVGDVRVLQRLGAGLDEQAIQAVRRWTFAPAQRLGVPVDVLVEVAVEFKLR